MGRSSRLTFRKNFLTIESLAEMADFERGRQSLEECLVPLKLLSPFREVRDHPEKVGWEPWEL